MVTRKSHVEKTTIYQIKKYFVFTSRDTRIFETMSSASHFSICFFKIFSEVVLGEYESRRDPDCEDNNPDKLCVHNVTRTVSKVIIHENYGPGGGSVINDIALIRLNKPVPLFDESEKVRTFYMYKSR